VLSVTLRLLVALVFLPAAAPAAVQATAARIDTILGWLPAQPAGIGAPVTDRAAWAAVAPRVNAPTLLTEADRIVNVPTPELPDDLYLAYSRTGNRTTYETPYNARKDRLTHFAWAEALDRRGRYLPALQREIDAILAEKTWVLPAHDASLVNFRGTAVEVDLGVAMRSWALATVAHWFGNELGGDRFTRIQSEIRRRVVDPYLNAVRRGPTGGFWWINANSNWNAVCHAGVAGAALATVADRRTRAEVVAQVEANLAVFLTGFTDDGLCSEGIGYWSYGFGHYALLGEALHQATGGRLQLLAGDKTRLIAEFPTGMEILPRIFPAFSDNAVNVSAAAWVAPLARRLLAGGTAPYASAPLAWSEAARDYTYIGAIRAWTPMTGTAAVSTATTLRHWFGTAQVLVTRAASDFGAAIKGGNNDELHNHNDLGSFVVALGRSTPLVDPGSEIYTARTFSANRYDSKVLNSYGHPVPLVAGRMQPAGARFAARVLAREFSLDTDRLVLDLRGAYDVAALQKLERTFTTRRGAAPAFEIRDTFEFSSPQTFGTALITFQPWRQRDATTLEIGTGAEAVLISLAAEGGTLAVRSEILDENLPGGLKPTRLGLDFTAPLLRGTVTTTVTRAAGALARAPAPAGAPPARLGNLSSRGETRAAAEAMIAGLVVQGSSPKPILFRASGPTLGAFGVADTLRDPQLVLYSADRELARNDDWHAAPAAAAVTSAAARLGAFPFPAGSRDAALVLDLPPGAYTAHLVSADGTPGVGLLEAYDAGNPASRLVNLATRGRVSPGDGTLVVGLVVAEGAPRWFLIRGVAPGLATFGVEGTLPDPVLSVFRDGTLVAQNDDWAQSYWQEELAAVARQVQAFALDPSSRDAALLLQLPPGNYTVHLAGKGTATGTALGEIYEVL
jgi:hypothetical protein